MTDELRHPAPSPQSRSRAALPENIRATLEASNLPIEVATAIADLCERSDTDTLREERDTAVAHANGLTDLIRRMDTGYVRGLEDAERVCKQWNTADACRSAIRALKAAHAAQINAPNHSAAGLAESQAPTTSELGDGGVAPTGSAPSGAPITQPCVVVPSIHDLFEEVSAEGEHMDDVACWQRVAQRLHAMLAAAPSTPERSSK